MSDADPPSIRLEGAGKRLGTQLVLRDLNLEVGRGRVVVLRGSNGAGKTTLLRLLATRLRLSKGRGAVFGFDLVRRPDEVRKRVGLVSVLGGNYPILTARENLRLAARLGAATVSASHPGTPTTQATTQATTQTRTPGGTQAGTPSGTTPGTTPGAQAGTQVGTRVGTQARTASGTPPGTHGGTPLGADGLAAVDAVLDRVGLSRAADALVRTYSSGMKKRLGLGRLLLLDPALWLLDEPYAALDEAGKELVDEALARAKERGRTVLLASHDHERSKRLADAVLELEGGTLRRLQDGSA